MTSVKYVHMYVKRTSIIEPGKTNAVTLVSNNSLLAFILIRNPVKPAKFIPVSAIPTNNQPNNRN